MAISSYVEQILISPVYVFDGIVDKIIGKNLYFSKIELRRCPFEIDVTLMESVKLTLKDLEQEEGLFSCFLYEKFAFEIRKNKKREQLIYLGSELKSQHKKIKSRISRLYTQKEHLAYTIVDLKRLAEGFKRKDMFFEDEKVKNKNKFYITKVERKINELQKVQLSMLMKHDDFCEIEKIYDRVFKSVPRHENLHEETHLLLEKIVKI